MPKASTISLFLALGILGSGCGTPQSQPDRGFVLLTRYDVKSLDPCAVQDWTTGKVLGYLYPSIGQICEISSSDLIHFELKVKPSKFTNGDPVTANDIYHTLARCLVPDNQSTVGFEYANQIVGATEYSEGKSERISGVEIIDPNSLKITLKQPDSVFGEKLKNRAMGVVNSKLVGVKSQIKDYQKGYGAGEWSLTEFHPEQDWTLTHQSGKKMTVQYIKDSATRRNLFESGEADYALFAPHESGVIGNSLKMSSGGPKTLVYLQLNPASAPFFSADQRRAMRQTIYQGLNFNKYLPPIIEPTNSILALSVPDYKPTYLPVQVAPTKEKLEVVFADIGMQNPAVEAIITHLRKNGWNVGGRAVPSTAMLELNRKGKIAILFTGWQPDFPGQLNTIPLLFRSDASENRSGFKNPIVDSLLKEAQRSPDSRSAVLKANQIIENECPAIPLYIQNDIVLKRAELPE